MSLVFLYEAELMGGSDDISDRCRKYTLTTTENAEEGSLATSELIVDDPDGDYEIKGFRRLRIYESEATDDVDQLVYNGFIVNRKVIRGPYRTGAGRQWVLSLVDVNVVAEFRVLEGSDANRPAETDIERLEWLTGTDEMTEMNRLSDTTFVNTSGPVDMDAVDYRGQRPADVINSCAQESGKNYFVYTIEDVSLSLGLWYDFIDSDEYTSDIVLTNDIADVLGDETGMTYYISLDTDLDRSPDRVYSGGHGNWDGGTSYAERPATYDDFTRRDAIVPMDDVKTSTQALARINRYLEDVKVEEDRITTSVLLPNDRVNWIRAGQRVKFRATHFPEEYRTLTWQRVLRRTVKQYSEMEYLLTLTLGWSKPLTSLSTYSMDLCNAIIGPEANRDAENLSGGTTTSGEQWAFVITNNVHDPRSLTDAYFNIIVHDGIEHTVYSAVMVPGEQGAGFPTSPWPGRSGTFTVPTLSGPGTFWAKTKSNYTGSGGPAEIDECWHIELYRI